MGGKTDNLSQKNSFVMSLTASVATSVVFNIIFSPINIFFYLSPLAFIVGVAYFIFPFVSGVYMDIRLIILRFSIAVSILVFLMSVTGG